MRTNHSVSTGVNNTRFIFAASIAGVLAFTACGRKSTTEAPAMPVNPSVALEPSDSSIQPVATAIPPQNPVPQTRTVETARLGDAIDVYEKSPTEENRSSVNLAFAKLDAEIAELKDRAVRTDGTDRSEATAKSNNLQNYRASELLRFTRARDGAALGVNPPVDSRSGAQKAVDTAEMAGDKVENGARRVGTTLKRAAIKTGDAIEDATH